MDNIVRSQRGYSSDIMAQLKIYLQELPINCEKWANSLLELSYQVYLELNSEETQELKEITDPLEKSLSSLIVSEEEADRYMNIVYELCSVYERRSYIEGMKVGARLVVELMKE
ncbi:MAG: hypothetical protein Q4D32_11235 [Eubacteriales bacterium]|nr:hypothetical protein [Eubacteriales bacterium]